MALCARCGRQAETDAKLCLACSARPAPPGNFAPRGYVRPYVQLAGTPGRLPVLAVGAPRTEERAGYTERAWRPPAARQPARQALAPARPVPQPAGLPPAAHGSRPVSPWLNSPPSGRWVALTAAAAVVVIAAGAATLAAEHHGARPSAGAGSGAVGTGSRAGSARHGASTRSAGRRGATLVGLAPAAAKAADAHTVAAFVTRYFSAIDSHSYTAYRSLYSPPLRPELSAAGFAAGYQTTRDSAALVRSISAASAGGIRVAISFTSHQSASDSPTHTSCTVWSISLYLARSGSSYVITSPPHGYQPSFRACSS